MFKVAGEKLQTVTTFFGQAIQFFQIAHDFVRHQLWRRPVNRGRTVSHHQELVADLDLATDDNRLEFLVGLHDLFAFQDVVDLENRAGQLSLIGALGLGFQAGNHYQIGRINLLSEGKCNGAAKWTRVGWQHHHKCQSTSEYSRRNSIAAT